MLTRREALTTGLAALAMPLAAKKEKSMVAIAHDSRTLADDVQEPGPLVPCHPKNDARAERLAVLLHAVREDCTRLLEEHGASCDCPHCEVAAGFGWTLQLAENSVTSDLVGWQFFWHPREGEAGSIEESARRLQLPVDMIVDFVAHHTDRAKELVAAMPGR